MRRKGWDKSCVTDIPAPGPGLFIAFLLKIHSPLDSAVPTCRQIHQSVPSPTGGSTVAHYRCKAKYTWRREREAESETGGGEQNLAQPRLGQVRNPGTQNKKRSCLCFIDLGVNKHFHLSGLWLCWVRTTASCLTLLKQAAVYTLTQEKSILWGLSWFSNHLTFLVTITDVSSHRMSPWLDPFIFRS